MKSIFLSVVVICALTIAGVGGTLAGFSDTEESTQNYIAIGSLDLKVNTTDDKPWGDGVDALVTFKDIVPCEHYKVNIVLENEGQAIDSLGNKMSAPGYIHFKDFRCSNVTPTCGPGIEYPVDSGIFKPEPELVAEFGGKVNCTEVNGIGVEGDECSMGTHVSFAITTIKESPATVAAEFLLLEDLLIKIECTEFYLFDLEPCVPKDIHMWVWLKQDTEKDWGRNFIPNPGEVGYDEHQYTLFNDWPSWALMKDQVNMTIEFDLTLADLTQPQPTTTPQPTAPA